MIKVLVVEDEIIVAKDIEETLQNLGYSVTGIARSAEEAIELSERTEPEIVLMDIMLEGKMDGTEAAKVIRARFITSPSYSLRLIRMKRPLRGQRPQILTVTY